MNTEGEEAFRQREINWMRVWRQVTEIFLEVKDNKYN